MRIFLICSALLSIVNSVPLPQNQSGALQPQIQPVPAGPPGRPIGPPPPAGPQTTPVPIISQTDIDNGEGNFTFGFVAGNGISVQESGYIRQVSISGRSGGSNIEGAADEDNSIQVLTGSYSYTAPDGTNITLTYVADENGFQPQGEHLPTPPPIPESVQRLLSSLPQNLAPADQGALSVRTGKALDSVSLGATNTANVVAAPVVASVPLSATVSGAAPGASVSVGPARGSGEIAVDASASSPLVASALTAVASDSPVVQISPADKVVS